MSKYGLPEIVRTLPKLSERQARELTEKTGWGEWNHLHALREVARPLHGD
jgi:hypothetical protein